MLKWYVLMSDRGILAETRQLSLTSWVCQYSSSMPMQLLNRRRDGGAAEMI